MDEHAIIQASAVAAGLNLNANGGFYRPGVGKTFEEKLGVARIYLGLVEKDPETASIRKLALEAKCSRNLASKIIGELKTDGGGLIIDPKTKPKSESGGGAGSKTFSLNDCLVLLELRKENNRRTLADYQKCLYQSTGTMASHSVISKWFATAFEFKATFRKLNQVPVDKFKDDNIARAYEYSALVQGIAANRLKFTDEKHLKAGELYNKDGRRCPLSAEVESMVVDSDFRNTYTIIGFCGIDEQSPPFDFILHAGINNADSFSDAVYHAYCKGFLRSGDVLVMDNASIHHYREASALEYVLMEKCGVLVLYLPPRAPELNPIELLWNTLVKRLKRESLECENHASFGSHRAAHIAKAVMEKFTHDDVRKVYKKCNYIQY